MALLASPDVGIRGATLLKRGQGRPASSWYVQRGLCTRLARAPWRTTNFLLTPSVVFEKKRARSPADFRILPLRAQAKSLVKS